VRVRIFTEPQQGATYDQLLSYVVFADWLFFGLTAGALVIVRRRERRASLSGSPVATLQGSLSDGDRQIASMPGHPWTTFAFIAVAAGIVVNSFFVYPTQSLIGSAILGCAAIAFVVSGRPAALRSGARV